MEDSTQRECVECGNTFDTFARVGRPVALCSQGCRVKRSSRMSAERRAASRPVLVRHCLACGGEFSTKNSNVKCCSSDCAAANHRRIGREHMVRKYQPIVNAPRPCGHCLCEFIPKKSDAVFCCRLCQQRAHDARRTSSKPSQRCHKCDVEMPDRKPGLRVCDGCRVDCRPSRDRQVERERQRRFRTYGITEAEYDAMLASQDHRCAICQTDTPTAKGWVIDHCHESDMVRGILCGPCNSAIGLLGENPRVIADAAAYVKRHLQIRLVSGF